MHRIDRTRAILPVLVRRGLPALLVISLAGLVHGGAAQAQDISVKRNGEMEARFNDGCVVYYDSRGYRTGSRQKCSNKQVRRADDAVAERRNHAQGGWNGSWPQIVMRSNSEGEARFRGGCRVYYKRNGVRDQADQSCTRDQRRQADEAMARYRREQGLDHQGGGGGAGGGLLGAGSPQAKILETGFGLVSYGDGCRVNYDLYGNRKDANNKCSPDQIRRADEAMRRHREDLGYGPGTGGGWNSGGGSTGDLRVREVSVDRNGKGRVDFRDGCLVTYDKNGRRDDSSGRCSREQHTHADQEMVRYRRQNGLN